MNKNVQQRSLTGFVSIALYYRMGGLRMAYSLDLEFSNLFIIIKLGIKLFFQLKLSHFLFFHFSRFHNCQYFNKGFYWREQFFSLIHLLSCLFNSFIRVRLWFLWFSADVKRNSMTRPNALREVPHAKPWYSCPFNSSYASLLEMLCLLEVLCFLKLLCLLELLCLLGLPLLAWDALHTWAQGTHTIC